MATSKQKYLIKKGLSYRGDDHEPGEVVDDIPGESISWLLEDEAIEKVPMAHSKSPGKKAAATRAAKQEGEEIAELAEEAEEEAEGTDRAPEEILEEKLEQREDGEE